MNSVDRDYINKYNPINPWREANNFGSGNRSPEHIAYMLSQANTPVYIAGPMLSLETDLGKFVTDQ